MIAAVLFAPRAAAQSTLRFEAGVQTGVLRIGELHETDAGVAAHGGLMVAVGLGWRF